LADPTLVPADANDLATALVPVPRPAADSDATLLPSSLDQILRTASDTGALATPRSTKREVGEESTVPGPEGGVHGVGDPLPSPPVLLSAEIVRGDKDFVVFIAAGSLGTTLIVLRGRVGDDGTPAFGQTSVPDHASQLPSPSAHTIRLTLAPTAR
jgi:hypothetical protein